MTTGEKEILEYAKIVLGENELERDKSIYLKQVSSEKLGVIDSIKKEISKGGKLYKPVQWGKAGASVVIGGLTIVGSGALEFFSGGTATAPAVAGLTFGGNSVANGIRDGIYCFKGEYDKVGKEDYLRDGTEIFCGVIGGNFGHKVEGQIVGETAYYAGDLFSSWKGLTKAYDIVTSTNKYMKTIYATHIELTLTRRGAKIEKRIVPAFKLVSNVKKYTERVKKIYSESIEASYRPISAK